MEDKAIKQIKTSCPFPLLIYRANIKYNEVKKASGIAYILLEMIDKAANSGKKISDVLLSFGIPADLHYLFGKELAGLIGTDIIQADYPAKYFTEPRYFSQITMGEIFLTEKGKRLFREGAIPTGQEKIKQKDIYFDPVRRKFDISYKLPYADLSTSSLGEDFIDRIDLDISGIGDYINANPTEMGLKTEERIVSFETEEPQKKAVKQDGNLTIVINQSGVEFKFATNDETAFFNRYFTSAIMKSVMLYKPKYRFAGSADNPEIVPTVRFEELNATNLYIPDDMQKQAKMPCDVFLGRGRMDYENIDTAIKVERNEAEKLLGNIDDNAEFALLDDAGCKYYRALNVAIPCAQLNDIFEMQLLVESQTTGEHFRKTVQAVFDLYKKKPFDNESGRTIAYAAEALNNGELFEEYAKAKLTEVKTVDEKIGVLLKLNSALEKANGWRSCFVSIAESLYAESVKEIKLDNMIYKNTVLSPLVKEMGMTDIDYITSFSQSVVKTEDPSLVYQALSSAGFDTDLILGIANVVELYLHAILDGDNITADNDLASTFSVLQVNFNKINDMLGIGNLSDYTIKDDYNADEFFNAYRTFIDRYKSVEKYRRYAMKEFEKVGRYIEIYEPIQELLSIEKASLSHPEKITKKYIEEQIRRGRYKEAVCDLLIKAQFDLRKLLNADSTVQANELIDEAKDEDIIDVKQANALHKLRICRNRLQHPDKGRVHFEKAEIENWCDIVFSVKGGEK